jgi:hypothetical protein
MPINIIKNFLYNNTRHMLEIVQHTARNTPKSTLYSTPHLILLIQALLSPTEKHGSQCLEDGSEDTRLSQCQRLGSHRSAKRVSHIVGTDAKGEHESNDEAEHNDPYLVFRYG